MESSNDNYKPWLSAYRWTGKGWLFLLCGLLVLTVFVYLWTHGRKRYGYEYVSLTADQLMAFTNLVDVYPDTGNATFLLDTAGTAGCASVKDTVPVKIANCKTVSLRKNRARRIEGFLKNNLKGDVSENANAPKSTADSSVLERQLTEIDTTLRELNAKDVKSFVTGYKFKVDSYFWLTGNSMYWEAILWSLFGVFTSLIYYVSLANQLLLKNKVDDDIGPFDASEISAQVAKMFYAPAVTVVVVLGYSSIAVQKQVGVDIGVGHGLIVFAFLAGFYSGRLMKLLDKIKTTVFPDASDGTSTADDAKAGAGSGDITVTLKLADSMSTSPDATAITEGGFNKATVTLEPAAGGKGNPITLTKPADDQGKDFTSAKVPFGKYTLKATLAFDNKTAIINLTGSDDIEVAADKLAFSVALAQSTTNG